MTAQEIQKWNQEHEGISMVLSSGGKSHFMCADTLLQVYEQLYSGALARQRAKPLERSYSCILFV